MLGKATHQLPRVLERLPGARKAASTNCEEKQTPEMGERKAIGLGELADMGRQGGTDKAGPGLDSQA